MLWEMTEYQWCYGLTSSREEKRNQKIFIDRSSDASAIVCCLTHSFDGTNEHRIDRSVVYCTIVPTGGTVLVVRFSPSNDEEGYHLVEFYMKGVLVRCEHKCAAIQIGNGSSSWWQWSRILYGDTSLHWWIIGIFSKNRKILFGMQWNVVFRYGCWVGRLWDDVRVRKRWYPMGWGREGEREGEREGGRDFEGGKGRGRRRERYIYIYIYIDR